MELDLTEGMLFRFAAHISGAEDTDASRSILADAAQAYGLARLGLDLPYALARGRNPLPPGDVVFAESNPGGLRAAVAELCRDSRMHLMKVKSQILHVSPAMKSVLLPLALVEPYLRALEKPGHDAVRDIAEIAPLTRLWRLGVAAKLGRI
jgi:phytoene synthase